MTNTTNTAAPAPRTFMWVFDSSKCRVYGHKLGCQAVAWTATDSVKGKMHRMGQAAEASELDDMGHPVSMCKCTK